VTEAPPVPVRLRLYSRPGCDLCDAMQTEVDAVLADRQRVWEIVDVDSDASLAARYGESIPILFVNGRLFAKVRLPRLGIRFRLIRAAEKEEEPGV